VLAEHLLEAVEAGQQALTHVRLGTALEEDGADHAGQYYNAAARLDLPGEFVAIARQGAKRVQDDRWFSAHVRIRAGGE